MVENLGFTNIRDREEMETKEKMQTLFQGSWQLLHAPIAPPLCINTSNSQILSLVNLKREKTPWMKTEDPRRSGRASQHPKQPPRASLSCSRWREILEEENLPKSLARNMFKYLFLTHQRHCHLAPSQHHLTLSLKFVKQQLQ